MRLGHLGKGREGVYGLGSLWRVVWCISNSISIYREGPKENKGCVCCHKKGVYAKAYSKLGKGGGDKCRSLVKDLFDKKVVEFEEV